MNTNGIIGLVALIVVVGGGAWWLSNEQAESGAPAGTTTFAALIARGGNLTCDVSVSTPDAPAEGTTYISGDQVRADITVRPSMMGGAQINAHMIQSGGYIYSWSDMVPQGFKMEVSESVGAAQSQGFDVNAQVEYSCSPWLVDASKFTPPAAVTFTEFSADAQTSPTP